MPPIYAFHDVGKTYAGPGESLDVLRDVNLTVEEGESVAIVGASGSGKSTLLHLMGALDVPTRGVIDFEGRDMASMGEREKAAFRNRTLGFVFQFHHLLPEFTPVENVAMPFLIGGVPQAAARARAREILERVGLGHRLDGKVATLSGGERQRIAIARAVSMTPRVLLADEPTGNLDEGTGGTVVDMLRELNREMSMTMVIVTHNRDLASRMHRVLELKGGNLVPAQDIGTAAPERAFHREDGSASLQEGEESRDGDGTP
jgi:lipoprotein-releasing system ATP-binding protein